MDLQDTPEQAEFRAEVRQWIDKDVPAHLKGLRQSIVQGPGLTLEELTPLDEALAAKLIEFKAEMAVKVAAKSAAVQERLAADGL